MKAKSRGDKEQSEMIRSINLIVKWVGIVIIPIGLILFWQSHFVNGESITKSVTSTVAAIIGMIPEGLVSADHSGACLKHYEACKEKGFAS